MDLWRSLVFRSEDSGNYDAENVGIEHERRSGSRRHDVRSAVAAGSLALIVLGVPIALLALLGLASLLGALAVEDPAGPRVTDSVILFALSGLLIADAALWIWAGLLRFPLLLTTVATTPPVIVGLTFTVGALR